jgi:hypothetical protein
MKLRLLFITGFAIITTANITYPADQLHKENIGVGRYQLFQGEYKFVNIKGEEHNIRELFKIDTVTGKLYVCDGWQLPGKKAGEIIQRKECRPFEEESVFQK